MIGPHATTAPSNRSTIDDRVLSVSRNLQDSLSPIALSAAAGSLRPGKISVRLDLDKSLSSRLVRALRSNDPMELIHYIPSPTGLRMFLEAARREGIGEAQWSVAEQAVDAFQDLLDGFPGGRGALDTLISDSVTDIRLRSERTAKQAVFKAMSHLLGFHCDSVSSALILQPSEDGEFVDGLEVSQRAGIRRLRPNTPVAVFSLSAEGSKGPVLDPIARGADPNDPHSYILPEFSSPSIPPVVHYRDSDHHVFALSDEESSIHDATTVGSGFVIRRGWSPVARPGHTLERRSYLLHYPCKLLVRDLYIRKDLYVGAEPDVHLEFPAPTGVSRLDPEVFPARLNSLDLWAPIEYLSVRSEWPAVPDLPGHSRLVEHGFRTVGWDQQQFRGYRVRIVYPVPMILLSWQIPLPSPS